MFPCTGENIGDVGGEGDLGGDSSCGSDGGDTDEDADEDHDDDDNDIDVDVWFQWNEETSVTDFLGLVEAK